jgi:hypothetical protein
MRLLLLSIIFLSFSLYGQEEAFSLRNVREGSSFYAQKIQKRSTQKLLNLVSKEEIQTIYQEALRKQDQKKLCAYTLNEDLSQGLRERSPKANLESAILILRQENEIDDVVVRILLKALEVKSLSVSEKDEEGIFPLAVDEKTKSILAVITSFENRFSKNTCFDEAYKNLIGEILKINKKTNSTQLESFFLTALIEKRISEKVYIGLEQARISGLEVSALSLSSYQQKIRTLRAQYPLRNLLERSHFVALKQKKLKVSHRQKLFEQYSDIQIIMMGNVIKKLRERLEYDSVEISGYRNGVLLERMPLEPMERFRFAIKALRKEMAMLAVNTFFNGRAPDYIDLMVASFEIGIIPASELESVASLEEIWNPKKTFWDKAGIWVKAFASVATIAIPPPYGFIPALVVVIIEATANKSKDPNTNDPTSMF